MEEEINSGIGCIALMAWFIVITAIYLFIMERWMDIKYIDGHYTFNPLATAIMFNIGTYIAYPFVVLWTFGVLCSLYFKARGLKK